MGTTKSLSNNHVSPSVEKHIIGLIARCEEYVRSHPETTALVPVVEKMKALIPNLIIEKGSRYIIKESVKFEPAENTMYIGKTKDGIDYAHLFLKELIQVNMAHPDNKKAISEGMASLVATNIVGNETEDNSLMDEEIAVTLLSQIVGFESVVAYAVDGNKTMLNQMVQIGATDKEVKDLLSIIEHNYEFRKTSNFSNLAEIQNRMIDIYSKKPDLTKEEIENFGLQICDNPQFASHQVCKNIETVRPKFDIAFSNYEFESQRVR